MEFQEMVLLVIQVWRLGLPWMVLLVLLLVPPSVFLVLVLVLVLVLALALEGLRPVLAPAV
jgi:hypothetical protein